MIEIHNKNSLEVFDDIVAETQKNTEKQIIVVSDPPFNIGYKYNTYKDRMSEGDYLLMLKRFFNDFPSVVILYPEIIYRLASTINKYPERVISWVYNSNTAKQHRDIAFFGVKPDMSKVRQPYKNPNDKRIQERIKRGCTGAKLYDWWEINQVKNVSKEKTKHPCQMPLEVMKRIIGILPDNIVVVDPFMGSGTTGKAVIDMNEEQDADRDFIGIEIDKVYCDISAERLGCEV